MTLSTVSMGGSFENIGEIGIGRSSPIQSTIPPVLDHELTVYLFGAPWKFLGNKITVSGHDINSLITHESADVSHWLGLAEGLTEYRQSVVRSERFLNQMTRFESVMENLLNKIMGCLKKVYDQKMSGLAWSLENGQLILNGINIRSFLALYKLRKTEKAKKFLKGLKTRLGVLLENRDQSSDYERVRDVVEEIYQEIETVLGCESSSSQGQASRVSAGFFPLSA